MNEATQNFRPAIAAISQSVDSIIEFIKKVVQIFDAELRTELSPAQKNEVSHQLHCTLQAMLFFVKTFLNEPSEISDVLKSNIDEIVAKCVKLLDNPDLPMDTKNNASMLIVMHAKLVNDNRYIEWIKDESNSFMMRLSLIFGVISTLNTASIDYQQLATISIVLKNIYMASSVDPTSMLSVARSFMQVTKKLSTVPTIPTSRNLIHITETALSIAFLNLEHHVDSVRHLSRDTLRFLSEIGRKLNDNEELLKSIFSEIKRLHTTNLSAIVVISISPALKTSEIIAKLPGFIKRLLKAISDNIVTNHNLINCYEALAMKSLEEISFEKWYEDFAMPPIEDMSRHKLQSEERTVLESLVVRFVKKEKKVLDEILKNRGIFEFGFILLCLSSAKKTGRYDKVQSTSEKWKGLVNFEEIKTVMIHADDSVRTSALMLIIESRKTTEGFNEHEIECIMLFLRYNVNVQSPSMRQSILGLIKTLFVRIQSVLQSIMKKKEMKLVEFYFNFLVQLQEFCLENLFEGANFTRRTLSLRILFYVVEGVQEFFEEKSTDMWSQSKFDVLMEVLNDPFEANKEMAIEIMKSIPKKVMKKFTKVSREQLEMMVTSIKPPLNLTSSYLMEFVVKFTLNVEEFPGEASEVSRESFLMLTWCEKLINSGLDIAEQSLTVASSTNPLYGLAQNIRHLLSKLDLKSLGSCQLWRDFFARLIVICKRLTDVVAPVVNNSSPEGILPSEEFEGVDEATKEKWLEIVERTTPQIILLCSWRTVKEVSLLLGDICLKAPLVENNDGLLSVEQILTIGDHFLELLSQTKHRGAFEQCFFGFSQLCLRLWQCKEPELHKLPSEMLNQMIDSISGKSKDHNELLTIKNLCATRRSAGLPFMIQALITSELKVSTNKNFHYVMKNLIEFCRHGEFLETRTHSLNILRALFRCSDLNDAIGEYIADGIKCAILGYGAESWIERNSSTLLFSSLMVRIFGVQRTKDSAELNIRNKMTGRIFFLRYPELYDFFMVQLEEAADYVKNVRMNAKLHPLLLLLIRLYPSALEGSESNLKLSDFIPVVAACSGCVEMQTRILCAKFIASVSPPDTMVSRVQETLEILTESAILPANVAHGILLQILHQVDTLPAVNPEEFNRNEEILIDILITLAPIGKKFRKKLILFGTVLDIVWEIYVKLWNVRIDHQKQLENYVNECLDFDLNALYGLPLIAKKIFLLKQMTSSGNLSCPTIHPDFLKNYLKTSELDPKQKEKSEKPFTSAHLKLCNNKTVNKQFIDLLTNSLLFYLDYDYALSVQSDYGISDKEIFIYKQHFDQNRSSKSRGVPGNELSSLCHQLIASNEYNLMVKAIDILSMIDYPNESFDTLQEMIDQAKTKPEHLKKSMLKLANQIAVRGDFVLQLDFEFLVEISTDSSSFVK